MYVTTIELVIDIKKEELKAKLSACSNVEEFDIEELDKEDYRKNVLISFSNPIDISGIEMEITDTLGLTELPKKAVVE